MPRKSISKLLEEEAEKLASNRSESTVDVTAEVVSTEITNTENPEATANQTDLAAVIQDLHSSLEKSQAQETILQQQVNDLQSALAEQKAIAEKLTQELEETKQAAASEQKALTKKLTKGETALAEQKAVTEKLTQELEETKQTASAEQKAVTEKLTKELEEAKQTILQLAEANSQLIEENKKIKPPQPSSQLTYRKSHRPPDLPMQKTPVSSDDFAANTWLYD
jgi:chromosome segregation ATPase